MDGSHLAAASIVLLCLSGCAVIKTTDVTDASYKRHQSISVLGWPLYSRITDQDHGVTAQLATSAESPERNPSIRAAELLGGSFEVEE
jgi:hypothetical protein